ncbi:MAG: hypothetical protein V7731_03365 [Amphritea sp.]
MYRMYGMSRVHGCTGATVQDVAHQQEGACEHIYVQEQDLYPGMDCMQGGRGSM